MSNKTILQTNNTDLQSLIDRVNTAKDIAASLPEAGGGGCSLETCTVTYNPFSPAVPGDYQIKYTDSTGKINTTNYNPMQNIEIVCQKNTLIFFEYIPATPQVTAEDGSPWYNFFGRRLVIAVTSNTIVET